MTTGVPLLASVITYAEVLTGARRGHHDIGVVRELFARHTRLLDLDVAIAERAAELRGTASNKFSMPDALVLAASITAPSSC